ncbi:BMP8A protein, partial [Rostratula benghalensis]|nr:BMP8A protein [Rostratula benghalensis]
LALLWAAAVLCQLGSGSLLRRRLHAAGFLQRRLSGGERRDVQREILAVLGLPGRPRPRIPAASRAPAAAAPLFMLDLYHAVAGEEEAEEEEEEAAVSRPVLTGLSTQSPPPGSVVSRADTVVSLVNMGERGTGGTGGTGGECSLFGDRDAPGEPGRTGVTGDTWACGQDLKGFSRTGGTGACGGEAPGNWGHRDLEEPANRGPVPAGHSVDPGSAGLLGRRGPRSKQPFMVTFFRASPSPARVTRAAKPPRRRQHKKTNDLPHPNKLPGIFDDVHATDGRQVCRRHELYVSFQDLGWLDWVIAPQGYSAYYCEGECAFPLDSCMNATNHAILQSLVHLMKPEAVPKACCAPTKLSATSVLYYDSNNNVILKKHRNMVVKSCGCH